MRVLFSLTLLVFIVSTNYGAEQQDFEKSKNITKIRKGSLEILKNFYGDHYIPENERRMNPGTPPYVPHKISGDFKDCKTCHKTSGRRMYSGVRVPLIPEYMPMGKAARHPDAKGSCRICHVNQSRRFKFSKFYLKEVFSRNYKPKK